MRQRDSENERNDEFRRNQLRLQEEQLRLEQCKTESKGFKLKQYGDAIRNSVSKLTENSPLDFLPFIANFERLFNELSVPADLRVSLIAPYLSDRCRTPINRLQGSDATSYDYVKNYLMEQLRLVLYLRTLSINLTAQFVQIVKHTKVSCVG